MSGGGRPRGSFCGSLLTFIVGAGIVVLVYWAVFQPHHIRAVVVSATLTNFTVSSSNAATTVSYGLAVGISLYNPSLRVSIYYDALDAQLRFRGVFLGTSNGTTPAEFLQRRRSADDVRIEFDGRVAVGVPGDVAGDLEKEKAGGAVSLEVAVDARVRYKFSTIKIRQKPRIWCSLTIPVKTEGAGAGDAISYGDRCRVKY